MVSADKVDEYKKVLISYYEDELKKINISNFLKEKCWIKMTSDIGIFRSANYKY